MMTTRLILPKKDQCQAQIFDEDLSDNPEKIVDKFREMMSPLRTRFTVSVEGNIGSGKSTLLEYFSPSPNVNCLREPVDKWCDIHGENALEKLYADPQRWSFSFNLYALLTRVQMHQTRSRQPVRMLERSLFSTRYCFVENSVLGGDLKKMECDIIDEWFNYLITSNNIKVDLFVYLRAPPEICMERIRRRNRKEETSIPMKLINNLHELHEKWLLSGKCHAPVLVLDASNDLPVMKSLWEDQRQSILCGYV